MNNQIIIDGGKNGKWVKNTFVPPGESRPFHPNELPAHLKPAPAEAEAEAETPEVDSLLAHLDKSVKVITELLPSFSDEELDQLEAAENNGNTRTTLIAAFAEERLERANKLGEAKEFLAKSEEEITAEIDNFDAEDITYLVGVEQQGDNREELLKLFDEKIQAEVDQDSA